MFSPNGSLRCLSEARARGVTCVEVKRDVHEHYLRHMWQRTNGTVFKDRSCTTAHSDYLDRHGDASLPLPHTPWWRVIRDRRHGTLGYRFGASADGPGTAATPGGAA